MLYLEVQLLDNDRGNGASNCHLECHISYIRPKEMTERVYFSLYVPVRSLALARMQSTLRSCAILIIVSATVWPRLVSVIIPS